MKKEEKYIDRVSNKELNRIVYYYDNNIIGKEVYIFNNEYHREDGPAIISYYTHTIKNTICSKYYYNNGKLHNESGPAYVWYLDDEEVLEKKYYINGKCITDKLRITIIETSYIKKE